MTAIQPLFSGELLASLKDEALERLDTAVDTADLAELDADPGALDAVVDRVMPKPPVLSRDRVTFEIDETTLNTFDLLSRPRMKDGITVLCSLHFLSLARRYGTRVIALKAGKVAFDGLPRDIDERLFKEIYGEDAVEVEIGVGKTSGEHLTEAEAVVKTPDLLPDR